MNFTVAQAIQYARAQLNAIDAQHEARELLKHVLYCDATQLLVQNDQVLNDKQQALLIGMIEERLAGRPLQYILGEWDFMGLTFTVREGVLIPRADTETLCEQALVLCEKHGYKTALDLCTGSGCIAVALAKLGKLIVTAADLSEDALKIAAQNAQLNQVGDKVRLMKSDMFESIEFDPIEGEFDLIVSNPPYIRTDEMDTLMREVRDYEPHMALCGGADGLDFYRIIALHAPKAMKRGGALLVECGINQAADIAALFHQAQLADIEIFKDICGIERVVKAEKK